MELEILVISLQKTPERLERFIRNNKKQLPSFRHVLAVDGEAQWNEIKNSKLISPLVKTQWSRGAIGAGLSHVLTWEICIKENKHLLILEDDTLLADQWLEKLEAIIPTEKEGFDMLLLGWNLDSVLRAEIYPPLECISLFEPIYPGKKDILKILNTKNPRRICKLKNAFGLPGYIISPKGASNLIDRILPFNSQITNIGRGIPSINSYGIDALLNNIYNELEAIVVIAPLVLALNESSLSLTKKRSNPMDFGKTNGIA